MNLGLFYFHVTNYMTMFGYAVSLSLSFYVISTSSHRRCSVQIGVLKNFIKFTGKHLCQSLFFNKVAGFLLKKRLWHRCFPVNFAIFLITPFLHNTSGRLLLYFIILGRIFMQPKLILTLIRLNNFLSLGVIGKVVSA